MGHNRPERQKEVEDRFEFTVFDGEYHFGHAVLAALDGYFTGGQVTWEFAKQELTDLFGDVGSKMIDAGIDPTTEPMYVDYFVFNNWQDLPLNNVLPLPNKFVPYVAARKKGDHIVDIPVDQPIRKGKMYFFRGNQYARFDLASDKKDSGYPKKISAGWSGVWAEGIDAAVRWPSRGKVYFFRGDRYVRFDIGNDKVDNGYPKKISAGWPGVWSSGIDATVHWPDKGAEGKIYFFRGDEYIRYDLANDRADSGYPKKIAQYWSGLWAEGIDASVYWPDKHKIYFFRGNEYVRYNMHNDQVDNGYPKKISAGWPGVWTEDIAAAAL